MRKLLFLILLIASFNTFSQITHDIRLWELLKDTSSTSFNFSLQNQYLASPTSDPQMLNYFLLLHYAEKTYRNDLIKSLKDENFAGLELYTNIWLSPFAKNLFKDDQSYFSIQLKNSYEQYILFTKDMAELLFSGNKKFAGKSAFVDPLKVNVNLFQSFELTFNSSDLQDNIRYGIGLSYLKGSLFTEFSTYRAELFTSETGDSVYLDLGLRYRSTDQQKRGLKDVNGNGLAFNGYVMLSTSDNAFWYLSMENLGFIKWNKNAVDISMDTNISFSGFDILSTNPFDTSKSFFIDTFQNLDASGEMISFTTSVAPRVKLVYFHQFNDWFSLLAGSEYKIEKYFFPEIYLNGQFKYRNIGLMAGLGLDQYKNPGFNFGISANISNTFYLDAGTHHLQAFGIAPFLGQSMYFRATFLL